MENSPTPPSFSVELESNSSQNTTSTTAVAAAAGGYYNEATRRITTVNVNEAMARMKWALLVVGVCFAAISAVLQALQTTQPLPPTSQLVYAALVISFTAVVVSIYIRKNYTLESDVLMHVGFFFGATALVMALVIHLHIPLMATSITIFLAGIFIVIMANLYKPAT